MIQPEATDSRFQSLLEAMPDAIVGVDSAGRVKLVNGRAERLFGYSRAELIGLPVGLVLVTPGGGSAIGGDERDRLAGPTTGASLPLTGRRKDGSEFPAEVSVSAIEAGDGSLIWASVRDVTARGNAHVLRAEIDRRRLEGLRAEVHRLRAEDRRHESRRLESLEALAGAVAHDFNNLLGVILNYTAFVAEELTATAERQGGGWDTVRSDLSEVRRATERAIELTHQLMTFGRRQPAPPAAINLNDAVREAEPLLERTLGGQVQLALRLQPKLWTVSADPARLEQALINLADNAREAMPGGGKVALETENVVLDGEHRTGQHVRLRFTDTGIGMSPEVLARAFEPFFTTKAKGLGSGLGLATVYGLVKQAGGDIEIRSEPGTGTTVSALFPVTEESE